MTTIYTFELLPVRLLIRFRALKMAALMPNYAVHIFLLLALCFKSSLARVPDFNSYPANTVPCLSDAAVTSGCSADSLTVQQSLACLCSNIGGFLTLSAVCIQENAPGELQDVYNTTANNCATTNTPVTISWAQFLAAAQESTSTLSTTLTTTLATGQPSPIASLSPSHATDSSPTHTITSSPNPSATSAGTINAGGGGGLGRSDIIAMAIGIPATVFTIIGVFLVFFMPGGSRSTTKQID